MKFNKNVVKVICFSLIFCVLFQGVSFVFRDKICSELILGFEDEPKNSLDVLFLGSSMIYQHVYPYELWEEFGITSYNLGTSEQTLPVSYYLLEHALERQNPKVVVLDVGLCNIETKKFSDARLHQVWDNLSWSSFKIKSIGALAENPETFYIDLIQYHGRWKNLKKSDFQEKIDETKGASSCMGRTIFEQIEILNESEQEKPTDVSIEYLEKIILLCKSRNIDLVFSGIPTYQDAYKRQRMFNYIEEHIAQQNNINFVNFNYLMEELDIRWERDFYDGMHLNYFAGQKITKYLGEYLQENCAIPDHRGEDTYNSWNEGYENYRKITDNKLTRSGLTEEV